MRLFKRKSHLQRLRKTLDDSLPALLGKQLKVPGRPSDKSVKVGLIAAGGLTGLTAGSAGISSLRRRAGANDAPDN